MGEKVMRILCVFLGILLGYYVGKWFCFDLMGMKGEIRYTNLVGVISAFAMLGYLLGPFVYIQFAAFNRWLELIIENLTFKIIISATIGLILGLLIANLLSFPLIFFANRKESFFPIVILLSIIFGYLGLFVSVRLATSGVGGGIEFGDRKFGPKILDTSVIIDGRIADICKTGFLEGNIVIPDFVSQELRHIADSPDPLRRNRGRRGLDVVKKMQEELDEKVIIYEVKKFKGLEADEQLVSLAKEINGVIVTNDFNLNKQATIQGVKVLNINELANAVKSIVLPGEEMEAQLIKEGKEREQGVAYLDDGTMIVVEEGRRFIGETVEIFVTNVLQTPAGRVVFAKIKTPVRT